MVYLTFALVIVGGIVGSLQIYWMVQTARSAERQLRAYISIVKIDVLEQRIIQPYPLDTKTDAPEKPKGGVQLIQRFQFTPLIKNTGATPAYKVQIAIFADKLSHPIPENFNFRDTVSPEQSNFTLGPGQKFGIPRALDGLLEDGEIEEMRKLDSVSKIYCYGVVRYIDAFRVERHTEFCVYLLWSGDKRFCPIISPRHNEAT